MPRTRPAQAAGGLCARPGGARLALSCALSPDWQPRPGPLPANVTAMLAKRAKSANPRTYSL